MIFLQAGRGLDGAHCQPSDDLQQDQRPAEAVHRQVGNPRAGEALDGGRARPPPASGR
ncbi:hypothetical protein [Kitasatospora phosalacinea]|uniref:hypothetical protein n=1 Tax=Kitasatospora phosalacinea TaxID=2065 RepID=UPI0012FEB4B2|nr:hypothetical protein [Kitasatospora phosalacinea]